MGIVCTCSLLGQEQEKAILQLDLKGVCLEGTGARERQRETERAREGARERATVRRGGNICAGSWGILRVYHFQPAY